MESMRGFTVLNLHAQNNAHPWLGCKGADTVTVLKWLAFLCGLFLADDSRQFSREDMRVLNWMLRGARNGLRFTQGIFGHGVWMLPSCTRELRQALQEFGTAYGHLAHHCLGEGLSLFGMVPKFHALLHFRTDCDDALRARWSHFMNPAMFDNSMSEDFIGRIARISRRIPFRDVERTLISSFKTKAHFAIREFKKRRLQ